MSEGVFEAGTEANPYECEDFADALRLASALRLPIVARIPGQGKITVAPGAIEQLTFYAQSQAAND